MLICLFVDVVLYSKDVIKNSDNCENVSCHIKNIFPLNCEYYWHRMKYFMNMCIKVISTDLFAEVIVPLPGGGGSCDFTLYCACTFCGKMMRRSSLKRHIEDRHLPSRAAGCQYCSKVFRSNNSLQNHLSIYHRNTERNRKLNKAPSQAKSNVTSPSSTWIEVGHQDEWIGTSALKFYGLNNQNHMSTSGWHSISQWRCFHWHVIP